MVDLYVLKHILSIRLWVLEIVAWNYLPVEILHDTEL